MAKRSREDFEPSLSPEPSDTSSPVESVSIRSVNPTIISSQSKIQQLDPESSGEASSPTTSTTTSIDMRCSLPPHRGTLTFQTFEEYEVHYAKEHTHRCLECRKNFPTAHFLNLHIEENHDSLVMVRRERGEKTYSCFVTDCDRVCSTPQKRRMHLIDKHCFPKDYDFFVVNDGIDRRSSMLRSGKHRRNSSAALVQAEKARRRAGTLEGGSPPNGQEQKTQPGDEGMDVDNKDTEPKAEVKKIPEKKPAQSTDEMMEDLVGGISALKFIPPSVRFGRGRGKGRGGFSRT